jgi:hypothetical protein
MLGQNSQGKSGALATGGVWDEDTKFIDDALKELLSNEVTHISDMKKLSIKN